MQHPNSKRENALYRAGHTYVAGADEAGRGAWAGPIVAAAVVLPPRVRIPGIRDSKQLSPAMRERLSARIIEIAVAYQICAIAPVEIDRVGIGEANRAALRHALTTMGVAPTFALVDALPIGRMPFGTDAIIRGDAQVVSIAAASIVAKVSRDRMMRSLHQRYPNYGFVRHKGYGTLQHRMALQRHGISAVHRRSFAPMAQMLTGSGAM